MRATPKGGGEVQVIGEAPEYLDAVDRRARELSALAEGVPMAFSTRGHPRVDHIRVTRSGATFELQVISHVGVSLPHHAASQIGLGAPVSIANLEPGDLIFFGSPIHHVGMYVGGGKMIEAPYTGARVRIASMDRSDYAGACRPH